MKKVHYLITLISATLFGCNFNGNNDNLSIGVKSTDAGYSFEASYPEKKTEKVVAYLEKTLGDDKIFTAPSDIKDEEVALGDSVKFYLKSSPGNIEIDFKKQHNSEASYVKLVNMCKGVKEVLK
ncbi:hypothetical protein EZ428_06240 [Pedobacter frigiditerrae]|uniref:Lipoprotein n=1 Tax=Pedobacter frigiditerrae TaxID=2530452 RepID=A0A4R0N4R0_9SPHI|nr:hypothetical protein [Pedobacter frigiditerrae]TCC94367.1 hypothetical protein EZ428_06240 [Pedobacter frigiditerrae]